jgi:hypothetical protein
MVEEDEEKPGLSLVIDQYKFNRHRLNKSKDGTLNSIYYKCRVCKASVTINSSILKIIVNFYY